MAKKIISTKACKATKHDCPYAEDKKECFKYIKSDGCVGEADAICEGVRTPLSEGRKKILSEIKDGATLYWCSGPYLDKKIKCRTCGNPHLKSKEVDSEDYWLLRRGQYVKEVNMGQGNSDIYPITDKGKAACFNMAK